MTASELLRNIRERLTPASGNPDLALIDAEDIVCQSLNITRTQLYTDTAVVVGEDNIAGINTITERHIDGEPLPYILGKTYFYDREFFVDGNVLIPRPDTETIVETIINTEKNHSAKFIDIGTGSGIIAAVLTAHRPGWVAVGIDISYKALLVARMNASSPTVEDGRGQPSARNSSSNKNISLICCDMLTAVKPQKQFDFIVSNPPYISSPQMKTLDPSVIRYEPHTALHGGEDGLDYYRVISGTAGMYLKDGGRVYLEAGYDQGGSVPEILRDGGWRDIAVIKDLGGRDRVVTAVSP